jgi:hypothetical protein
MSDQLKDRKIKDLQENLEIQKQMFKNERERLEAILGANEREKREKENFIAEMKHENTQLRESMQQQLSQSQMSSQKELHRLKELEDVIRNLQYQN